MRIFTNEMAATLDNVLVIIGWAEDLAHEHPDLAPASLNVLLVCLQEMVANVALHATHPDGFLVVRVGLEFKPAGVCVFIEDNGFPFDPIKYSPKHVDTDLASAGVGGRGVRIVRQLTSAMSYDRVGEWNFVRLEIG